MPFLFFSALNSSGEFLPFFILFFEKMLFMVCSFFFSVVFELDFGIRASFLFKIRVLIDYSDFIEV